MTVSKKIDLKRDISNLLNKKIPRRPGGYSRLDYGGKGVAGRVGGFAVDVGGTAVGGFAVDVGGTAVGGLAVDVGGTAVGGLAVGGTAVGGTAVGGIAVGGTAVGGTAVGGIVVGGTAVGGLAVGGTAVDGKSVGGLAVDGLAVLVGGTRAPAGEGVAVRIRVAVGVGVAVPVGVTGVRVGVSEPVARRVRLGVSVKVPVLRVGVSLAVESGRRVRVAGKLVGVLTSMKPGWKLRAEAVWVAFRLESWAAMDVAISATITTRPTTPNPAAAAAIEDHFLLSGRASGLPAPGKKAPGVALRDPVGGTSGSGVLLPT